MYHFLAICLACTCVGFMVASCGSLEERSRSDTPPHSSLTTHSEQPTLRLHTFTDSLVFHDVKEFSLEAFVENLGDRPVTIFPSLFQMEFRPLERGRVSYVPVEQAPESAWEGALVLQPEEVRKITIFDLNGQSGSWSLERGSYGLSVRYFIEHDQMSISRFSKKSEIFQNSQIWVGDLQSKEMTIHYLSKGDKAVPLSMNR